MENKNFDISKPIGVFLFHGATGWNERFLGRSGFKSIKEEMKKNYGDNLIIITDFSIDELSEFSNQFNAKFGQQKLEVHFLAEHHQGTYNDREFASFLSSIEASHKRAIILSCGPASKEYHLKGFDYVAIPRPDENILGLDIIKAITSGKIITSYTDAVSTMRKTSSPEIMQEKLNNISQGWFQNLYDYTWNLATNYAIDLNLFKNKRGRVDEPYKPPVVATYENGFNIEIENIRKFASACGISGGNNSDCKNKVPQPISSHISGFKINIQ